MPKQGKVFFIRGHKVMSNGDRATGGLVFQATKTEYWYLSQLAASHILKEHENDKGPHGENSVVHQG